MDKIYSKQSVHMLRLDRGEEFIGELKQFCLKEKIQGGWFWGLGAISEAELAFYNLTEKKYYSKVFSRAMEVVSLTGNVAFKDGEIIIHSHGVFSNQEAQTIGGHINKLVVAATLEIFLQIQVATRRVFSKDIGLNLLESNH